MFIQHIDLQINGPADFETMYQTLRRQQENHDLMREHEDAPEVTPDLGIPRFRCQSLEVETPADPRPPDVSDSHERLKQARVESPGESGQAETADQSRDR